MMEEEGLKTNTRASHRGATKMSRNRDLITEVGTHTHTHFVVGSLSDDLLSFPCHSAGLLLRRSVMEDTIHINMLPLSHERASLTHVSVMQHS